jgi:hypothetical protein
MTSHKKKYFKSGDHVVVYWLFDQITQLSLQMEYLSLTFDRECNNSILLLTNMLRSSSIYLLVPKY